jgi:ABC-type transport system involved in multi-copper enzyme maturation permease subunit
MNARILKETRSLLPVFGVMLLGAVCPPLIWRRDTASAVGMCVFVACTAIMAASSFGNEFQWRTLPMLLAQPLSRRRLWVEKMLVLAAALAIGFMAFMTCTYLPNTNNEDAPRLALALIPLCALCSAPFSTLSIKNTAGAAAAMLILPVGGCLVLAGLEQGVAHFFPGIGMFLENLYHGHEAAYLGAYGLLYSALFVWLGYSTFMDLQVVETQARDITLPAGMETALARPLRHLVPGYTGPWASLFRKELQLQRISFIIAGLMVALTPLQLLLWKLFHSEFAVGTLAMNVVMCVFVIPLIATAMSVAEERNLGVAGWQFVQPVSAWRQWAAKILVVLFICVTLGVLLPLAGVAIGEGWFGLGHQPPNLWPREETLTYYVGVPLLYLLIISVGIYASSLSRTTLESVIRTLALILLFAAGFALVGRLLSAIQEYYQNIGPVVDLTGLDKAAQAVKQRQLTDEYQMIERLSMDYITATVGALMVFTLGLLQFLAYGNFRQGDQAPRRAWLRSAILVVLVCAAAFAVLFTTSEMLARWTRAHF